MTRLSVNINKVATLRNARGENMPELVKVALDCEKYGAEGITVHPRPDERHIKYTDVLELSPVLTTEFNIEGNPDENFISLVEKVRPTQVTLVPDARNVITSNQGWDCINNKDFLSSVCKKFKSLGIRCSIFIDPKVEMAKAAKECGADRIELYTAKYAREYNIDKEKAISDYIKTAKEAKNQGLGINAGHDLNLENLEYFIKNISYVDEVSIGHALICDALYLGLEKTIKEYLSKIKFF